MNPNKKFILVINGPMCAGKSTLTKLFMEKESVFRGSYDAIKWLIGGYSADNETHRENAKEITFNMISSAVNQGFSIIIDGGFAGYRKRYLRLADENNFIYLSLNIEAPLKILEKRFLERVESSKIKGNNISVTTLDGFHSRYDWYLTTNKDPDGIIFDSAKLSTEEISSKITDLINKY
jgi:predicted kinase